MPTLRSISSDRIDTEVCNVTAGASSPATYGPTRPRAPEHSTHTLRAVRDLQPIPAVRHNCGSGINSNGDFLLAWHDPDDGGGMTITA